MKWIYIINGTHTVCTTATVARTLIYRIMSNAIFYWICFWYFFASQTKSSHKNRWKICSFFFLSSSWGIIISLSIRQKILIRKSSVTSWCIALIHVFWEIQLIKPLWQNACLHCLTHNVYMYKMHKSGFLLYNKLAFLTLWVYDKSILFTFTYFWKTLSQNSMPLCGRMLNLMTFCSKLLIISFYRWHY